jgi:hypothetical protein
MPARFVAEVSGHSTRVGAAQVKPYCGEWSMYEPLSAYQTRVTVCADGMVQSAANAARALIAAYTD